MAEKVLCECGMGPYVSVTKSHLDSVKHALALAEKRADASTTASQVPVVIDAPATLGGEPEDGAQEPQEAASEPEDVAEDVPAAVWPYSDVGTRVRTARRGAIDIIVDRDPKFGGEYAVHVSSEGTEFDNEVAEHLLMIRPEELVRV